MAAILIILHTSNSHQHDPINMNNRKCTNSTAHRYTAHTESLLCERIEPGTAIIIKILNSAITPHVIGTLWFIQPSYH